MELNTYNFTIYYFNIKERRITRLIEHFDSAEFEIKRDEAGSFSLEFYLLEDASNAYFLRITEYWLLTNSIQTLDITLDPNNNLMLWIPQKVTMEMDETGQRKITIKGSAFIKILEQRCMWSSMTIGQVEDFEMPETDEDGNYVEGSGSLGVVAGEMPIAYIIKKIIRENCVNPSQTGGNTVGGSLHDQRKLFQYRDDNNVYQDVFDAIIIEDPTTYVTISDHPSSYSEHPYIDSSGNVADEPSDSTTANPNHDTYLWTDDDAKFKLEESTEETENELKTGKYEYDMESGTHRPSDDDPVDAYISDIQSVYEAVTDLMEQAQDERNGASLTLCAYLEKRYNDSDNSVQLILHIGTLKGQNRVPTQPTNGETVDNTGKVILSEGFDDVLSFDYEYDMSEYKNVAWVWGNEEESTKEVDGKDVTYKYNLRAIAGGETSSGLDRYEFMEQASISQDEDTSDDLYVRRLKVEGKNQLADRQVEPTYDVTLRQDKGSHYMFGRDFNIGDRIRFYDATLQQTSDLIVEEAKLKITADKGLETELTLGSKNVTLGKYMKNLVPKSSAKGLRPYSEIQHYITDIEVPEE